jgi:hypothetical protein
MTTNTKPTYTGAVLNAAKGGAKPAANADQYVKEADAAGRRTK